MYSLSYIKQEKTFVDDGLTTLIECLKKYADILGDYESVIFASYTGRREAVTWLELYEKSVAVAKSLIQLGVKPGEIVALNLKSCPEWLYIAFGTLIAGACVASLSFTYKDGSDFLATMKKLDNCSMLVMDSGEDGENWNIVKSLLDAYSTDGTTSSAKMPNLRYIISCEKGCHARMDGVRPLDDLINTNHQDVPLPEIDEDALALLLQTSGSTGAPKLIALSQRNMMFPNQPTTGAGGYLEQKNTQFNDRPFTWIGGFPWSIVCGQKRVTINGFDPVPEDQIAGFIDIIVREKCNMMTTLPPRIHALLDRKEEIPEDWPMQSLFTGGQPLTKNISKAIGPLVQNVVVAYGGSEFFGLSVGINLTEKDFKEYWCGKLIEGPAIEVKVVDEDEEVVAVNTRGEIYIKSEGVFQEYYNDPIKTAAAKSRDGWYKTDDIGMMTEDGDFYVYGRKSNMIISGGMNVAPEILEDSIILCPGIANVVVVPIPDEVYYQVMCACLIREKGSDVTEEQVRAFCEDVHNDKTKMFTVLPKYYIFLERFPETNTGKLSRPLLTELAKGLCGNSQM